MIMLRHARKDVKWTFYHAGVKNSILRNMTAKLMLRDKEYEVKPGMTLLDALKKSDIVPESVIATRNGEMITDDEVLRNGDVVKLIAVISGGSK